MKKEKNLENMFVEFPGLINGERDPIQVPYEDVKKRNKNMMRTAIYFLIATFTAAYIESGSLSNTYDSLERDFAKWPTYGLTAGY